MPAWIPLDEERLVTLNQEGNTNRQIASLLGVNHRTISNHLKKLGLSSPRNGRGLREVDGDNSKCSRCGNWYPTSSFPQGRATREYSYTMTFCYACRTKRTQQKMNSDNTRFLTDRWRTTKYRAAKLEIPFSISKEEWLSTYHEFEGKCFYTDVPLICVVGQGKDPNALSVDKVVPELGYISGNVVFCTNRINTIKYNMSLEEMEVWTPSWYARIQTYLSKKGISDD